MSVSKYTYIFILFSTIPVFFISVGTKSKFYII